MAQTGFTPIQLYSTSTAAAVPTAGNLTNSTLGSELAINITDGKLFYKDNANAVQVIGWKTTPTTAGGTGLTTYTAGDLPYYATGTTLSKLSIGSNGQVLTSTGTAPQWTTLSGVAVTTFSAGTTGFTPNSATSGAITLAGTLATTNGGTGLTSFTANGVFYASSTSAIAQSVNLTFNGTTLTTTGISTSNNLTFNSTGQRITGDFSSSPITNRVLFQTNVTNANTSIGVIPNGTGVSPNFVAYNNSDPTNASRTRLTVNSTESQIHADISGTGTYLPLTMYVNNAERLRITTAGDVGIGINTPAGGGGGTTLNVYGASAASFRVNTAATTFDAFATSSGAFVQTGTSSPLIFRTNSVEAARIDTSSNIGVGTGASAITDRFTVAGAGEAGTITDAGSKASAIRVASTGGAANGGGQIEFGAGYGSYAQSYFAGIKGLLTNGSGNSLGDLAFYTRNATSDTSLTERARIFASGGVSIGNTTDPGATNLSISGNVVIATSGKGIDFSATAGTGTSELLADYEEGNWTPNQGGGLTVTGTFTSSGKYTKIGRNVTVIAEFNATSISCTANGDITTNLPFAAGVGLNASGTMITATEGHVIYGTASGSSVRPVLAVAGSAFLVFTMTYMTS